MAIYDKLPTPQSTRILKFSPPLAADDSTTICCELMMISMTDPGPYYALSYVWGDPSFKEYTLICNGNGMKITHNLWAVLRRLG
ncbi:hypothetical protein CPB84DRAFT_1786305 [Gymnopilus junonius]|uniref:Heterokaryon incompatibility domain-containing protein n=1 Tax=Gymnopilus junonius TaxID=109634 RepID=A0A9P5NIG5_GYMJU|nr:hypothetical protein CPB84DRAFT_1786305 [Gymnopilus junonius]